MCACYGKRFQYPLTDRAFSLNYFKFCTNCIDTDHAETNKGRGTFLKTFVSGIPAPVASFKASFLSFSSPHARCYAKSHSNLNLPPLSNHFKFENKKKNHASFYVTNRISTRYICIRSIFIRNNVFTANTHRISCEVRRGSLVVVVVVVKWLRRSLIKNDQGNRLWSLEAQLDGCWRRFAPVHQQYSADPLYRAIH